MFYLTALREMFRSTEAAYAGQVRSQTRCIQGPGAAREYLVPQRLRFGTKHSPEAVSFRRRAFSVQNGCSRPAIPWQAS